MTERLHNFVDGAPVQAKDGRVTPVVDPSTGETYAEAPLSGPGDVDLACQAAATAFDSWRDTTPSERSRMLLKLADAIEARAEDSWPRKAATPESPSPSPARRRSRRCWIRSGSSPGRLGSSKAGPPASTWPGTPHGCGGSHRRGRPGHAVELPDDDGGLEDRTGAGGRQHGRPQAVRHHAGHHGDAGRGGRRDLPARRPQRHLRRPGHGPRPGQPPDPAARRRSPGASGPAGRWPPAAAAT